VWSLKYTNQIAAPAALPDDTLTYSRMFIDMSPDMTSGITGS
jgi:hypothetical protein